MNEANLIIIGGPISAGKSTLAQRLGFPQTPELDENNILQRLFLEYTYNKKRVAPEVIEFYFMKKREENYEKYSHALQTHVLDRSIFESLWFAKENLQKKSYDYFYKVWKSFISNLIEKHGKPKLYIVLLISWDTFKDRIFDRGREVEIRNFNTNKEFFKHHIDTYESHMKEVFELFDINHKFINTNNMSQDDVLELSNKHIKEVIHG
ncbi:MAG: deoxynucleoside kinase [Mycoplasmataceae bacterium]|nr:deoxynucleoside kinase [Mycoplasmataceae bacterium]